MEQLTGVDCNQEGALEPLALQPGSKTNTTAARAKPAAILLALPAALPIRIFDSSGLGYGGVAPMLSS